ncbi:BglG family transcription antiterminator LicT [Lacticaseibacillus thailandensis]|uniref:BglG family transcription antiterminator LicT n=1 Tax=Lacticaseibacillus thailandensis TaxID=381741 RepID=UPI0006D1A646|nr:PRD domain-containing protein [Lacticaseibacillus thailandensis]
MQIKKIFNNNVVLATSGSREQVLLGRGIGFQKHPGDTVDQSKVDQVYAPTTEQWLSNFKTLVADIDPEYFEVAGQIITMGSQQLQTQFNDNMLIALADHIHFAVYRHQHGIDIKNEVLWEIKRIYRHEYLLGQQAVDLIASHFKVQLPDDEAGFIAMKFVENSLNDKLGEQSERVMRLINGILDIVKYQLRITFDEDGLNYQRFLVHLRFFAQRVTANDAHPGHDDVDGALFQHIVGQYPTAYACVQKIVVFVAQQTQRQVTRNEQMYLTIHVQRVLDEVSHQQ